MTLSYKALFLGMGYLFYLLYEVVTDYRTNHQHFLLDMAPNILAVPISVGALVLIHRRMKMQECVLVGVGTICYEFLQIYIPERTFDPLDIVGSVIGIMLVLPFAMLINKLIPQTQTEAESDTS